MSPGPWTDYQSRGPSHRGGSGKTTCSICSVPALATWSTGLSFSPGGPDLPASPPAGMHGRRGVSGAAAGDAGSAAGHPGPGPRGRHVSPCAVITRSASSRRPSSFGHPGRGRRGDGGALRRRRRGRLRPASLIYDLVTLYHPPYYTAVRRRGPELGGTRCLRHRHGGGDPVVAAVSVARTEAQERAAELRRLFDLSAYPRDRGELGSSSPCRWAAAEGGGHLTRGAAIDLTAPGPTSTPTGAA